MNNKKSILITLIICVIIIGIYLVSTSIISSRELKEPKIITQISTDDSQYLQAKIFGFDFPKGERIEKARLTYGRDGGVCIQFKNINDYDIYISEEVKFKLKDVNTYKEMYVTIDGNRVDASKTVGSIGSSKQYIIEYKEGSFYYIDLFTEYIDDEVRDIFN